MRLRWTYIHRNEDVLDFSSLVSVTSDTVTGPTLPLALEARLIVGLDELPQDMRKVLEATHELHVKWAAPLNYTSTQPFLSRVPPGLHVFYTSRTPEDPANVLVCDLLRTVIAHNIDCETPATSFTPLPHDRFSHSTAFQYYQLVNRLSDLADYAKNTLCAASDDACHLLASQLILAKSVDISYDAISHTGRATAVWPMKDRSMNAALPSSIQRTELGILAPDQPKTLEPHELALSGVLAILGQDDKPSATTFSFPSRHRRAEGVDFKMKTLSPTGLHPTLQLTMTGNLRPPVDNEYCALHAYFTLPRTIFADKYQLSDPLFMASKNLTSLRFISQPVDLEAPDYTMSTWGSAVLLEVAPKSGSAANSTNDSWLAEIPLHLRYLTPSPGGHTNITVPYPAVFWACNSEEGTKFSTNPFDRTHLGYDGLFGPRTVFWHVDPRSEHVTKLGERLSADILVPVLDLDKAGRVGTGTAVAIVLGFAWVVWTLVSGWMVQYRRKVAGAKTVVEAKKVQ